MNKTFLTNQIIERNDMYKFLLNDQSLSEDMLRAMVENNEADTDTTVRYGLTPCQHDQLVDYDICTGCGRRIS